MFQIYEYLKDHNIDYVTEGHKHCQPGWVQMVCPFCSGNPGYHLGFNEQSGVFNCWRCGVHSTKEVLIHFHGKANWYPIFLEYSDSRPYPSKNRNITKTRKKEIDTPASFHPVSTRDRACHYLTKRGFDCQKLEEEWGLMASGVVGSYSFRVIAPIYYHGKIVSYQGRDYTGRQSEKYKACSMEDEAVHHKHILYGLDKAVGDTAVIVEGITDVWRLGPGAVATFGIKYTHWQIKELKRFRRICIFFDNDPQAVYQANKMGIDISVLNPSVKIELISFRKIGETRPQDPASMSQKHADRVMRQIFS